MTQRLLYVAAALVLTLVAPFALRPDPQLAPGDPDATIVIITPHHQTIQTEFSRAFAQHMKTTTGKAVAIDWRVPGGTSEIAKLVNSEFRAAFENFWENTLDQTWDDEVAAAFDNRRLEIPNDPALRSRAHDARLAFLSSNVGIGADLFFGGGPYDFQQQAEMGHLVARDIARGQYGPAALASQHPDWFANDVIPAEVDGEIYYDPALRWVGTCLSSFGIVYNRDSLLRLGLTQPPASWDDLGKSVFNNEIAVADPTKSGSVTKAFEMMVQQKIQEAVANAVPVPGLTEADVRRTTIQDGWTAGLQLLQRIGANARYFTDDATKIPRDVAAGDAAAGMCIDFYGRTLNERLRKDTGASRVGYLTPAGGSSFSVDPIGLFRGASQPDLAHAFIEFVLSPRGQRLWNFRAGTPGGPKHHSLRRLPIRKDLYTEELLPFFADPEVMPYERTGQFVYQPEYTAPAFDSLRFIVRVMCIDTHHELRHAWQALIDAGFPRRATTLFHDTGLVSYGAAHGRLSEVLRSDDRLQEVKLARDLADHFRRQYQNAAAMAERGE